MDGVGLEIGCDLERLMMIESGQGSDTARCVYQDAVANVAGCGWIWTGSRGLQEGTHAMPMVERSWRLLETSCRMILQEVADGGCRMILDAG